MSNAALITAAPRPAERNGGPFRAAAERVAASASRATGTSASVLGARQTLFRDVLAGAVGNRTGGDVQTHRSSDAQQTAREAAQDFVAVTFLAPVLKQLRDTNNAAPPFAPGPAEKQFGGLMDQHVARQIVRASHFPLVDRVAHDLLRSKGPAVPSPVPTAAAFITPAASPSPPPIGVQP